MSNVATLLKRNRHTLDAFDGGELTIRPRLSTILLTCVDARVDPAHVFDLGRGDAGVLRNAGGRITPAIMRDLAILGFLASRVAGDKPMQPELAIMHHTDCGMGRLADPVAQSALSERLGIEPAEIAAMAVTDPVKSVQADIELLRRTPGVPKTLVVSGLVYDVTDGTVSQVVA